VKKIWLDEAWDEYISWQAQDKKTIGLQTCFLTLFSLAF
jgi:hypothetical protein